MSYLDSIISDISYMSIPFGRKYKIFPIYFSGTKWKNCAVQICSVSDTLHALQRFATGTICPAWAVWYRVQTGAACPAPRRASVCRVLHGMPWYLPALVYLAWFALLPTLCSLSGCAGAGVSTGGVYSRRPAPPGEHFIHPCHIKETPHIV